MKWFLRHLHLTYGQKVFLLASLPLILAAAAIAVMVAFQSRQLAVREIAALEAALIEAKKEELRNYITLARNAFVNIYGRAAPDDDAAKLEVTQILSSMVYGSEGHFFVFDYNGDNLVSPRQTHLIGRNWTGLTDDKGTPITDELIRLARQGTGYHSFDWPKPSSGTPARMIVYVTGLQDWQWVVGTGVFVDDILATVAAARSDVAQRIRETFYYIIAITLGALMMVFLSGLILNIRERRLADAKLKALTQRVLDAQEEERSRVARELHDGISQMLVGIRYALDITKRRLAAGDARASQTLGRGLDSLTEAIQEVRRISRDLRPGVLDDLGLGPALKALASDFGERTGVETAFSTVVFRNRLDQDAKIALYRIAQEALTNVERHADASRVAIDLRGHRKGATLEIRDNGCGMPDINSPSGLGLRNMQERVDQLDGTLHVYRPRDGGTVIQVQVPLTHMLAPALSPAPSFGADETVKPEDATKETSQNEERQA